MGPILDHPLAPRITTGNDYHSDHLNNRPFFCSLPSPFFSPETLAFAGPFFSDHSPVTPMFAGLFLLLAFDVVNAGLFVCLSLLPWPLIHLPLLFQVVKPLQGSTCQAGKSCSVDWLDDGIHPLLTAIGVVDVGLYHGKQVHIRLSLHTCLLTWPYSNWCKPSRP